LRKPKLALAIRSAINAGADNHWEEHR